MHARFCEMAGRFAVAGILTWIPAEVIAAESSTGSAAGLGAGLAVLGAILLGAVLLGFILQAIFIHIAASLMSLQGTFGTAFKASILAWLLGIALGIVGGLLSPIFSPALAGVTNLAVWLLAGSLAIKSAYRSGFGAALLTFILSSVLTIVILAALWFFVVAALVGGATMVG